MARAKPRHNVGLAIVAVTVLLAAPATAGAVVSAAVNGAGTLEVTGDGGPNSITITDGGADLVISGATSPGSGCAGGGPVTCTEAGIARISGVLGDDIDVWDSGTIALPTTVELGAGFPGPFIQRAQTGASGDTIIGGPHQESDIVTGAGNDTIRTLGGDDGLTPFLFTGGTGSILAGPGDDVIDLGDGFDGGTAFLAFIDGGEGNDSYELGAGNDRNVQESNPNGGDDVLNAGGGDDGLPLGFYLGDGADTLDGGPGNDSQLVGSLGGDTIRGGLDDDFLSSEPDDGSDSIEGGGGNDTFFLGYLAPGLGDGGNDVLRGGRGRDTLQGLLSNTFAVPMAVSTDGVANDGYSDSPLTSNVMPDVEVLIGAHGDDTLRAGSSFADLRGNKGDDILRGGTAADVLDGGEGSDSLNGGAGNDFVVGGAGDDALNGARGNDFLRGLTGADKLNGGGGIDTGDWSTAQAPVRLTPGRGNGNDGESGEGDTLAGNVENEIGGPFSDTLVGARGRSLLTAGGGDDTIRVNDGARDIVACGTGFDRVIGDRIDILERFGAERCELARRRRGR
jgi:Ca2+-binding RTX toxin-like protein